MSLLTVPSMSNQNKLLCKNVLRKEKETKEHEGKKDAIKGAEFLKMEVENLKDRLKHSEKLVQSYQDDSGILKDLHARGIIDQDGDPING
jgi:hypothetical protein